MNNINNMNNMNNTSNNNNNNNNNIKNKNKNNIKNNNKNNNYNNNNNYNKNRKYNSFINHLDKNIYFQQKKSNDIKPSLNIENNKKYINNTIKEINQIYHDLNYENLYNLNNNNITNNNITNNKINYCLGSFFKNKNTCLYNLNYENDICIHKNIIIENDINNVSDLINLIEKNPLEHNVLYNINLQGLHNIHKPLIELNEMIALDNIKINIVEQILYFIQDFHVNSSDYLHTVIFGPPGTGKTELAKIIGKIFSKIGVLRNDVFKKVTRSDLIGGYLGQTAIKTNDVIESSLGGVLFIDEAYSLGNKEKKDIFSKECIDTLCEGLSNHRNDLMVIIAGYENELQSCFFNYNEGLESRFTWRYNIDKYNGNDLFCIFKNMVKKCKWSIDNEINELWFNEKLDYFKYYGRDIEVLLSKTKIAHSKRIFGKNKLDNNAKTINLDDLEKGFVKFLSNNNNENNKQVEYNKRQLYNSLYC